MGANFKSEFGSQDFLSNVRKIFRFYMVIEKLETNNRVSGLACPIPT
jgi:hypothetical protein